MLLKCIVSCDQSSIVETKLSYVKRIFSLNFCADRTALGATIKVATIHRFNEIKHCIACKQFKGTVPRDFDLAFFNESVSLRPLSIHEGRFDFFEDSRRYWQLKVHRRCC